MRVHARFRLDRVDRFRGFYKAPGEEQAQAVDSAHVQLNGVQGEPFGNATPSAHAEMRIDNPSAAKAFFDVPIGTEFDVYFSPVEKASE